MSPRYIVARTDGREIPADEPCFVIRGQDRFAVQAVDAYIAIVSLAVSPEVTEELIAHRDRLVLWQASHATKTPD